MKFLETMANSIVCLCIGHLWSKTWRLVKPDGSVEQTYHCMRWPCEARRQETVRG